LAEARHAPADGLILFDKPPGITSHDVVARVRRTFVRGTKVGHAGTLDPFATGLLLVLVGRATRVQRFLMELPKTYETTARFGAVSTTGDPEGEIAETGVLPDGELVLPVGRVSQRPPVYSAIKIGGRRAYALARAGVEVEVPEREVDVHRFEQTWVDGDRRSFVIECSSGTYVRSLIAELGDAYCEALRRTRIGDFDVADADPARVMPLNQALGFVPELRLEGGPARRAAHGVAVPAPPARRVGVPASPALRVRLAANVAARGTPSSVVRLTDAEGLIALAEPTGDGRLKPIVGFRGG
jgi:tRNA pseudouridine55 synthase